MSTRADDDSDPHLDAGNQMRVEIHKIISRYGEESDVSVYTTIGVLEVVKANLLDHLAELDEKWREDHPDDDGE